tara:strand:- start:26186 stop:26740 length:555 start_codon:yes stop_codon:yes gene_type:complete
LDNEIKKALNVLSAGGTILYPTDTIWGIGCDAFSDNAIKKVFKIKKRDLSKGLICLASSFEMVMKYVNINNIDLITKISKEAPTTFIFDNPRKISKLVSGNNSTIAFRVPQNNFCIKLIQEFGRPIVSTSANVSGDSFPNCYKEINPLLKDIVDYIVKYKDKDRIHSSSRIIKLCNDGSFKKLR